MGRTKKRSKAKSASARTRVEGGQHGASESGIEVARRENESSIAAKLPTKVLERIINFLCPPSYALCDCSPRRYLVARQRALNFALGLILELSVVDPDERPEQLLRAWSVAVAAHVGHGLRTLVLFHTQPARELFTRMVPPGGFSSLVELHIHLIDAEYADLAQAYGTFAHMPKLEYFYCLFTYRGRTASSPPRMPAPRRRLVRLDLLFELETPESIEHGRVELDAVADLLYVADVTSLRELKLNYNISHAVPSYMAPLLHNLRILRLAAPPPLFRSFPAALTSILTDLPHLVCLDVEILIDYGRDIGTISPSDAVALLAALPLSLEAALIEFDFTLPGSTAHLAAFLERRLASGVLKRWTSVRGTRPDATLKTTWRRYGGGGSGGAWWETEDFEESDASPRIV